MSSDFGIYGSNNPKQLEEAFGKLGLFLNRPEPCIICIACQYALHPSAEAVSKHLWSVHKTPPAARKGLNRVVKSLQFPNPSTLPVRDNGSTLHPHLAVLNGAACKICDFRTTSVELMGRHMSKEHRRKNDRKTWASDKVDLGVRLQSWTTSGNRVYWVVAPDERTSNSQATLPADCSPRRTRRVAALHDKERRRLSNKANEFSAIDTGLDDPAVLTSWMRRTGWVELFDGANRSLLYQLRTSPAVDGFGLSLGYYGTQSLWSSVEDERYLVAISYAVDRFLDRCEDTARNTDHSIRCWLRGQTPDRPFKAPFSLVMRKSSRTKYRSVWKSMLFFILRFYRLDDAVQAQLLQMRLSPAQGSAVEKLWLTATSQCATSLPLYPSHKDRDTRIPNAWGWTSKQDGEDDAAAADESRERHQGQGALGTVQTGDRSEESESGSEFVDTDGDIEDAGESEDEGTTPNDVQARLAGIQHRRVASKSPPFAGYTSLL